MTVFGIELDALIISLFLITLLGVLFNLFKTQKKKGLYIILILFVFFLGLRLTLEIIPPEKTNFGMYIEVLSWMVLSLALIKTFVKIFIQHFLETKHNINIPKIVQDLVQILAFIIISVIILKEYFKLDTSILVTSSVLSIVIGLALQDTLGNFFSGLAIQMQRPFEKGDWISINSIIGQVKDIDWRAIRVKTLNHDYFIIPNSEISKTSFMNHSKPTRLHRIVIPIGVSYKSPPNLVKQVIMNILIEEPEVLKEPEPTILLVNYNDFSIDYEIRVFTENFRRYKEISDSIYTKLWYQFKRNDIAIPFPIRDVYLHEVKTDESQKQIERFIEILSSVDFLEPLSPEELKELASKANLERFAADEIIIKQGENGNTFYIIDSGQTEVSFSNNGKSKTVLQNLYSNAFFGEMSLLTGSERSATVTAVTDCKLITINSEAFKTIIMKNPDIVNKISTIISKRQLELTEKTKGKTSEELIRELDKKSENILNKMRNFFGF